MTLLSLILGSVRIRLVSPRPERLVNAAHRITLPFRKLVMTEREASFEILLFRLSRLRPFLETVSLAEEVTLEEKGLPSLLKRYRKRFGFFAGIAVFAVSLLLANCFVWGVDLSGSAREPEEVFAALSEAGLAPGVWSRDMDTDAIARKFLILHPEYAYCGIRLVGMRALVELRDAEILEKHDINDGYSNMIAGGSGRVVRCEVMNGEACVKPGDLVQKGDLLISGIRKTENGSFRPARARGRVFCEAQEAFETFVPFSETETVLTGREASVTSYYLLGKKLFSFGAADPFPLSERSVFFEPVRFWGITLPLYRETASFAEKLEKTVQLNIDRARDIAYDRYTIYRNEDICQNGEIKAEDFLWEEREDGVYLLVKLFTVRDLCREVPFTVLSDS